MDRETELALITRMAAELSGAVGSTHNGLQDASLAAKGAHRTQAMLAEQARTVERIVDSLRRRSDELTALAEELRSAGCDDAAETLEHIVSDFAAAFGIAAGSMRRWVLANEACAEALNLTKVKLNAAIHSVLEAGEVSHLLLEATENVERSSAAQNPVH